MWICVPECDKYVYIWYSPKGDSGNVRRSIDLFNSNKQELQQGSQGFPAHHLRLKLIWWGCNWRYYSFSLTLSLSSSCSLSYKSHFLFFPTFFPSPPFVLSISEGLSPRGKEGVIWSLQALIKTSVWLTGISCADVWVSVYFSLVLWLHGNLSPFPLFLSISCTVSAFFLSFSLCFSLFLFFSGHRWSIQQRQVSVLALFLLLRLAFVISGWLADCHCSGLTLEPTVGFIQSDPTQH